MWSYLLVLQAQTWSQLAKLFTTGERRTVFLSFCLASLHTLAEDALLCLCRWLEHQSQFPTLFTIYMAHCGFQTSLGVLENDFGAASLVHTSRRNALDVRYMNAQVVCNVNYQLACADLESVHTGAKVDNLRS